MHLAGFTYVEILRLQRIGHTVTWRAAGFRFPSVVSRGMALLRTTPSSPRLQVRCSVSASPGTPTSDGSPPISSVTRTHLVA